MVAKVPKAGIRVTVDLSLILDERLVMTHTPFVQGSCAFRSAIEPLDIISCG